MAAELRTANGGGCGSWHPGDGLRDGQGEGDAYRVSAVSSRGARIALRIVEGETSCLLTASPHVIVVAFSGCLCALRMRGLVGLAGLSAAACLFLFTLGIPFFLPLFLPSPSFKKTMCSVFVTDLLGFFRLRRY